MKVQLTRKQQYFCDRYELTPSERKVLVAFMSCFHHETAAKAVGCSAYTFKNMLCRIYRKCGIKGLSKSGHRRSSACSARLVHMIYTGKPFQQFVELGGRNGRKV